MKKLLFLILALFLAGSFVMAEDIGLSTEVEFGIDQINKPDGNDVYPYIQPGIEYSKSFLDDALDLYAGLWYEFDFPKFYDSDKGKKVNPQNLYFDLSLAYNLKLNSASTLSVIVENENYLDITPVGDSETDPSIAKSFKTADRMFSIVRPGLKFNQNFEKMGDLYCQVNLPIAYQTQPSAYDWEGSYFDGDTGLGLDLLLGFQGEGGFGLAVGGYILLTPKQDDYNGTGLTGLKFVVSYETGPAYMEIKATVPVQDRDLGAAYNYFDVWGKSGVAITPKFKYTFDFGLSAYVYCTFYNIGVYTDDGTGKKDVYVAPAIGVVYSF